MKYRLRVSERARQLARGLSLREALAQLCFPRIKSPPSQPLGGGHVLDTSPEIYESVAALKQLCSIPPLLAADLECGMGDRMRGTLFPGFMGLGANDSEELAYEVGKATAWEARSRRVGLLWNMAPCVDVAQLGDSPVVSNRSASRDANRVLRIARGYLRGLQDHGVAGTLKHFPGDGYTSYDQHLTTPQLPLSMAEWWAGPGAIYLQLIASGAKSIMAGHLALPAYDEIDSRLALYPPATLSRRLLTDLLREELGFEGIIASDSMGMAGCAGFAPLFEAHATFLESGGDVLLFPLVTDRRFYPSMEQLILDGKLREATIYDRAERVIAFKEDLGILDRTPDALDCDMAAHERLAQRVIDGAPALVRDRAGTLPMRLTGETRVLHVIIGMRYEQYSPIYQSLTEALEKRCRVEVLVAPSQQTLIDRVDEFDYVICSLGAVPEWGLGVARLHGELCRCLMGGWMRLGVDVVFISHFHPFVHEGFEPLMDCIVNTFHSVPATGERLVKGLTGDLPFTGRF